MRLPLDDAPIVIDGEARDALDLGPVVCAAAVRIPIATLDRPALLAALQGISDEAAIWVCRSTDVALVTWLARVVLVVEQTRVALGDREP